MHIPSCARDSHHFSFLLNLLLYYSTVSKTGSPIDIGLVATVAKKRRMGSSKLSHEDDEHEDSTDDVTLSLDVGKGQYISLSDPSSLEHLDVEMKDTARTQLKVLQDQMAKLMDQLGN